MKFGVFTVMLPEYSPEEALRQLKEAGFDCVEWRVENGVPKAKPATYTYENRYWSYNLCTYNIADIDRAAPDIKRQCKEAGLEICSLATYQKPHEVAGVERAAKAAAMMDCANMRVLCPAYDGTVNYREIWDRTVEQIGHLEKIAKKYGVRILFETHHGTIIPTASAAYRLVSSFDPKYIGIILDPGNMVYEGFESYQLGVDLLGEYLGHVHVKNSCWKSAGTSKNGALVWKPDWAPLRSGYADLENLFRVLAKSKYAGYVSMEDFSNEADTKTKLRDGLAFLKALEGR